MTTIYNDTTSTSVAPTDSSSLIRENYAALKGVLTVLPCHTDSKHFIGTGQKNLTASHVSNCIECSDSKRYALVKSIWY